MTEIQAMCETSDMCILWLLQYCIVALPLLFLAHAVTVTVTVTLIGSQPTQAALFTQIHRGMLGSPILKRFMLGGFQHCLTQMSALRYAHPPTFRP